MIVLKCDKALNVDCGYYEEREDTSYLGFLSFFVLMASCVGSEGCYRKYFRVRDGPISIL